MTDQSGERMSSQQLHDLAATLADIPYLYQDVLPESDTSGSASPQRPAYTPQRPPLDPESMREIPADQAQPGDLVITDDGQIGIWIRPGKMIRPAPTTSDVVMVDIGPTSTIRRSE